MDYEERIKGSLEALLGVAVMSSSQWGQLIESTLAGAHAVAVLGGAVVAIHGVWRILKRNLGRNRRGGDDTV